MGRTAMARRAFRMASRGRPGVRCGGALDTLDQFTETGLNPGQSLTLGKSLSVGTSDHDRIGAGR